MNHLKDYLYYIINSHMYEKLATNHIYNKLGHKNDYLLENINISFTISPELAVSNPFSILAHKMFLEQIAGQKLVDHLSEKHINEFNLKKEQYIGSSTNLRNNIMYNFLQRFILLNQLSMYNLRGFIQETNSNNKSFSVGFTSLDAFEPVYSTFEKWALVPDHYKYGCYINIISNYENTFISELLLSHFGLTII